MENCYYCKKEIISENNKDNYDEIHFICYDCFLNKNEDWKKQKEKFIETDYKYDEWD